MCRVISAGDDRTEEVKRGRGSRVPWQQLIGGLVVIGLLWVLLKEADGEAIAASFSRVDLRLLPVLVLLLGVNFLIRSWRWRYLLSGGRSMALRSLVEATAVGYMASFLLPFRAGEVARPWMLARWEKSSFGAAVASIVVERVVDGFVVIAFLGLSVARIEEAPDWLEAGAKLLAVVSVVGLGMVTLAYFFAEAFARLAKRIIDFMCFPRGLKTVREKLVLLVAGFLEGLRSIRSGRQLGLVFGSSVVLWLEMACFYQVGLWTMGISLSPLAGMMVNVLVALAVAAPGPPGFVGTFQVGCLAALGLFGVSNEEGLSYSVVMHVVQAGCIIPAGLWVMHARGMKVRESMPSGRG